LDAPTNSTPFREAHMTVAEMIRELERFPPDHEIHLDIQAPDEGWEGERIVRLVSGLRIQHGFDAVAIDGSMETI
jgi:hypothetical protein